MLLVIQVRGVWDGEEERQRKGEEERGREGEKEGERERNRHPEYEVPIVAPHTGRASWGGG